MTSNFKRQSAKDKNTKRSTKASEVRKELNKYRKPSTKKSKHVTVSKRGKPSNPEATPIGKHGIPNNCVASMNRKLPPKQENPLVNEILLRHRQGHDIETIALRTFNGTPFKNVATESGFGSIVWKDMPTPRFMAWRTRVSKIISGEITTDDAPLQSTLMPNTTRLKTE